MNEINLYFQPGNVKNQILVILFAFLFNILYAQQKGVTPLSNTSNHSISTSNLKPLATTYAVVVGISDYQDPAIPDLRFADKDAEAFANYLRSKAGGSLDADHLKVLVNSQATMAQFANALDWLWAVCKEGDQAIIYFSGHGDVEKKSLTQPGFLLCWDAPGFKLNKYFSSGLHYEQFRNTSDNVPLYIRYGLYFKTTFKEKYELRLSAGLNYMREAGTKTQGDFYKLMVNIPF